MVERRKHKRFQVPMGAFVTLKPSDTGAGRLTHISMGGLRFEYITGQTASGQATELDIFTTNSDFRFYKVPCQTIWQRTTYESPLTSTTKRQCGVQFGELSPDQIYQLEYFIQNYTGGKR